MSKPKYTKRSSKRFATCAFISFLGLCLIVGLTLSLVNITRLDAQEASPLAPFKNWQSPLDTKHPLVGKIYSVKDGADITPSELIDRLSSQRHILLGEIHDNKDHHLLQAWIIEQLTALNRTPAIVMEQIRADQSGVLKLFMSGKFKTAQRMGPAIGWEKSGWPKWENYQPIARAAIKNKLPIYAGDTTRAMNRKVGKQGFKILPKGELSELGLDLPLGKDLDNALALELVSSHCDMMPAKMMGPMALVQRYRDAHLARALREANKVDGSILIAGNGHVRTDRAVPWYLRGEQIKSVAVMIVETSSEAKTALDLIPLDPAGNATADYIWVTPGASREDPCIKLKKQFGTKHGQRGKKHGKKAE